MIGSHHPVFLVDPLNEFAVGQQMVEVVAVAFNIFSYDVVCVLCQVSSRDTLQVRVLCSYRVIGGN